MNIHAKVLASDLVGVPNASRGFIVICDQTAWFSTLDLIVSLRPKLGYIGGYHATDPDHNFSFVDMEQMKDCGDDKLSKLTQHYVVVRSNTASHCYCIDMLPLPRPPKSAGLIANGAEHTFREFGQCLHNATVANCGQPPIGVAFDGGTAHTLLNRALLGLVFLVVSFNGSVILRSFSLLAFVGSWGSMRKWYHGSIWQQNLFLNRMWHPDKTDWFSQTSSAASACKVGKDETVDIMGNGSDIWSSPPNLDVKINVVCQEWDK